MHAMRNTVTVSNRTDIGQGWRVSCFALPDDDWNAVSWKMHESFHATEKQARKMAAQVAQEFNAEVL
jgi:hypothetical protein